MVSTTVMKIVSNCWRPSVEGESNRGGEATGRVDGLLWYKDSGPQGTFVGVYDGHGGPEAARFVNERLFDNIKTINCAGFTSESQGMSSEVITKAFLATDEEFLTLVKDQWMYKPQIASVGACCLVGIICSGLLYIANAGDSRAVLGRMEKTMKEVKAIQLSSEHNASIESVREELHALHPDDPQIVVLKHKVWRVKGLIQVSRSLGDAYLKRAEFNREPLLAKFRLPNSFDKPILLAEPAITVQKLVPEDQFLIFASDGLWEHLTNQEAVDIVQNCPRNGVARKLLKAALHEAAKKREMRYSDLKKIERGVRRHFHDDITIIVLFLDSHTISRSPCRSPRVSIRGGGGVSGRSATF
ncbi:Probable protein phosphatase 2C 38 [Linum perenne]